MKRLAKTSIGVIGFAALVALAAPAPARAGNGGHGSHGHGGHVSKQKHGYGHMQKHKHGHSGYRGHRGQGSRHFVVPRHIDRHRVDAYGPYHWKRSYYRSHRHHHVVYRFPVWTPYGVVHRPYAYCEGALFDAYGQRDGYRSGFGVSVRTPHLSVSYYDD